MADKFQFKRATAAQWTSSNPILSAGEPGFETDTGKFKIGNGSSTWTSLSYTVDANYGTIVTQDSDNVNITGGSITGTNGVVPVGGVMDYVGVTVPSGWLWIPLEATTISQSTYSDLFGVLSSIDWFAPNSTAASNAATAGTFHLPTLDDCYVRGGIHGTIASADNANNEITIEDQRGTTITDSHLRDGSPMRFYGADLPSGLSNYTTYYLCWDSGNSQWKIYTTEDDAVSDSGSNQQALADDGSGTMYATQFGISLDDAMQRITGGSDNNANAATSNNYNGAFKSGGTVSSRPSPAASTGYKFYFDSAGSPDARTSNESRGRTGYMAKIIYTGV